MNRKKFLLILMALIFIGLVVARIYLPIWVTKYVNDVLNNIEGYNGSVEDIGISLYRGAYQIHNLKIVKETEGIPIPFIEIEKADISIQWKALIYGRIVSDMQAENMILNFAVSRSGKTQTGEETDWTKPIKDLTPFDINLIAVKGGKITYKDFSENPKVDLFIENINTEVTNLRNVEDKVDPMPSSLEITGDSIGKGKINIVGKLNILKKIPDMNLDIKLTNANLPALNDFTKSVAAIDFKSGNIELYSEILVKDNKVSGYVKPIIKDIQLIDLKEDNSPMEILWESIATFFMEIFKNHPKDQFATTVELTGSLNDPGVKVLPAIFGIFKNAFIKALSPSIDNNVGNKISKE